MSSPSLYCSGPRSDPGINQRALTLLFEEAEDRHKDWTFHIQVSVIEIYNESVRDLLSSEPADKLDIKLNQDGNLHVPGSCLCCALPCYVWGRPSS